MNDEITCHLEIVNEKGLHARAAAKLVEVVDGFVASAEISHDGQNSGGDSIMGLLMLAASKGKTIDVRVWGPEAQPLAEALTRLVEDRFGEDM